MGEQTIAAPARRSLGARTMTEAFRLTVEDHPDRVAVRTKDDEVSLTWAQLRDRVDALAGGLAGLGVRRGDTVALMMGNRPEFHIADLAVMTLGATPFSIYPTFTPGADRLRRRRRGREGRDRRGGAPGDVPRGAGRAAGARDARRRRGRRGRGRRRLGRRRGRRPGFDPEPHWRARRARGPAHADLHVRHDRAAQGRPARAPQHHGRGAAADAVDPVPRRLEGHLVAARRAHRRAQRAPLPADRVRHDGHDVPEPARDRRLPAGGQADLVLRRAAHLREAQGRASRGTCPPRASRPSAGSRPPGARSSSSRPASRCPTDVAATAAEGDAQLFSGLRAMLGLDEALAVNAGAAPTPRDVLVFFHAIGIPLAELWGMSETCGVGAVNPIGAGPDRHGRPAVARASSSSSPTTASCSSAATS